jgi:hypothetical protein
MPVGVERKPRLKGTKSGTNVILHGRKERKRRTIYERRCNGKTYGNIDETNGKTSHHSLHSTIFQSYKADQCG